MGYYSQNVNLSKPHHIYREILDREADFDIVSPLGSLSLMRQNSSEDVSRGTTFQWVMNVWKFHL